jgi:hypothetical protein
VFTKAAHCVINGACFICQAFALIVTIVAMQSAENAEKIDALFAFIMVLIQHLSKSNPVNVAISCHIDARRFIAMLLP